MSRQSYIDGFCKAAEERGFDPRRLAEFVLEKHAYTVRRKTPPPARSPIGATSMPTANVGRAAARPAPPRQSHIRPLPSLRGNGRPLAGVGGPLPSLRGGDRPLTGVGGPMPSLKGGGRSLANVGGPMPSLRGGGRPLANVGSRNFGVGRANGAGLSLSW